MAANGLRYEISANGPEFAVWHARGLADRPPGARPIACTIASYLTGGESLAADPTQQVHASLDVADQLW
jgi:hypothetical protein